MMTPTDLQSLIAEAKALPLWYAKEFNHKAREILPALITALEAQVERAERAEKEAEAYKLLCEGKDGLLIAYRTGSQPTQKTWNIIDKAKKKLAALSEATREQE